MLMRFLIGDETLPYDVKSRKMPRAQSSSSFQRSLKGSGHTNVFSSRNSSSSSALQTSTGSNLSADSSSNHSQPSNEESGARSSSSPDLSPALAQVQVLRAKSKTPLPQIIEQETPASSPAPSSPAIDKRESSRDRKDRPDKGKEREKDKEKDKDKEKEPDERFFSPQRPSSDIRDHSRDTTPSTHSKEMRSSHKKDAKTQKDH